MTRFWKAPEQPVETDLSITEDADGKGVFVKWFRVPKAETFLPQHAHDYAHVSVIAAGGVKVWEEGQVRGTFHAPSSIVIPAGKRHTFRTLFDNTVLLCIHRSDVAVLEEHQIV
jgi:quercetin dioxygenase-like cupin family protein